MALRLTLLAVLLIISTTESAKIPANKSHRSHGKVCTLNVLADYLFFERMAGRNIGEAKRIVKYQLNNVNRKFKMVDFDNDGRPDNIGFKIKTLQITTRKNQPGFVWLNQRYSNSDDFVEAIAKKTNAKKHCMTLVFTSQLYKDESGADILGAATRAEPNKWNEYGICRKKNVAYVTMLGKGAEKSQSRDQITHIIMHELGHAFGAMHQKDDSDCSHSDASDNTIMSEVSSSYGSIYDNTWTFTDCNKRLIVDVLSARGKCLV